jgi:hypothetical protein
LTGSQRDATRSAPFPPSIAVWPRPGIRVNVAFMLTIVDPRGDLSQTPGRPADETGDLALPLAVGQPLPSLPVWLSETQTVTLDLEASNEETCRVLRISK